MRSSSFPKGACAAALLETMRVMVVAVLLVGSLAEFTNLLASDLPAMIEKAKGSKRGRVMTDLTPKNNDGILQPLVNTSPKVFLPFVVFIFLFR